MPKKKAKVSKAKNITQTVIVNVGKKRSAPTRPSAPKPTPYQQMSQLFQPMVASLQAVRPADSLLQSAQLLQRLIEPTTKRLDLLQPQVASLQPQVASLGPQIASLQEMVKNLQNQPPPTPIFITSKPRETVLDLPDEQLITPTKPLVPAGPQRLDDPHEDVPIREIEYVAEEKQEASKPSVEEEPPGGFDYENITLDQLNKLPVLRRPNTPVDRPTLREVARYFNIPLGRTEGNKDAIVRIIAMNRGLLPSSSSTSDA